MAPFKKGLIYLEKKSSNSFHEYLVIVTGICHERGGPLSCFMMTELFLSRSSEYYLQQWEIVFLSPPPEC